MTRIYSTDNQSSNNYVFNNRGRTISGKAFENITCKSFAAILLFCLRGQSYGIANRKILTDGVI